MKVRMIEQRDNGVCLFELKNDEIKVITSNLGCHVLSVFTKDREGNFGDVVLGFENVEDCWHGDGSYMGAIVGRVANRIGDAKFELNGKTYELAANNGKNSLHGGIKGFNQKIFKYELLEDGIRFIYLSPDMEEGYPGSLYLKVVYRLCDNTLKMEYEPRRIDLTGEGTPREPFFIRQNQIDSNHHVNNEEYVNMAMEYLDESWHVTQVRAEYKKPAYLHDTLIPVIYEQGNRMQVQLTNEQHETLCIVEFTHE